ncbi:MAG: PDZ domain-containing protein [Gemmatimonadetes bacterium]|nr:PDZ domain-containing protein [Gemmatimonadota bacterium]
MRGRAPCGHRAAALLALMAAGGWAGPAAAQPGDGSPRRAANQCDAIPAGPSPAATHPEGVTLLRLREELGAAQRIALQLDPARRPRGGEARRLAELQREMDSVLMVIVRGGDAAPPLRVWRPQVAAFIDSVERAVRDTEGELEEPAERATGYLGVSLSGAQLRTLRPDGLWVSHCEYPLVEAVDPGSPAARAGVRAGDTLVALGGLDLRRQAVSYAALLVPGERLGVQLRRGGAMHERVVTVGPRRAVAGR